MNEEYEGLLLKLPAHWTTTPIRYASTCLDGKRVPLNSEERSSRHGKYPYWGANGIVDSIDDYIFDEPLILLGEDGAPFFDKTKPVAFFVTGKIWVNNHIHILRISPRFEPRFVTHCLNATDYGPWIEGSTRDKLTQNKMGSILIPTPPLHEQHTIADHLDRETARLNGLVGVKERLLELLAEKRSALITRTVTRGLNPDIPLRNSGVPWIGEIPNNWSIGKLKYLATLKSGETITSESIRETGNYKVFGGNGLRGFTSSFTHEGHYVLIGRQGALCGNVHIVSGRFWASEHAIVVDIKKDDEVYWLGELLRAMNLNQYSESAAQPGLAVDFIANLPIPIPPLTEQHSISTQIETDVIKIDKLKEVAKRTITLLKERRTALITAVVTGKIKVA